MSVHRSPDGKIVRIGRVEQRKSWSAAFETALPPWLAVQVGAAVAFAPASSSTESANARFAAASAGGAIRFWAGGPGTPIGDIIPVNYDEIEFSLYGLRFDTTAGWNVNIGIGNTTNDRGVMLIHDDSGTTESTAFFRGYAAAPNFIDTPTPYQIQKPNGSQKPRNISLIWRPQRNEAFILEDDQVMAYVDGLPTPGASMAWGHKAMVTFTATDGGTHNIKVNRVDIALRHN